MARKSAKSKGYRKQAAKKPYLSKRDIAILCVLIVAVAIGAILLFRYDDGALKLKDGTVVTEGDNWLIVDGSNARGRSRYFKLGEMGEIEGYSRETTPLAVDANIVIYERIREELISGKTLRHAVCHEVRRDRLIRIGERPVLDPGKNGGIVIDVVRHVEDLFEVFAGGCCLCRLPVEKAGDLSSVREDLQSL